MTQYSSVIYVFSTKKRGKDKVTVLVESYRFMGQSYRLFRDRVTVYKSCRYSSESCRFLTKLAFISKHKVTIFFIKLPIG